jgi:hypothetical protein
MSKACFQGSGGYSTTKGLATISQLSDKAVSTIDISGSVQINFDVRYFNYLIGISKDISNIVVTSTVYDSSNDVFPTNSISISADDFVAGVTNTGINAKNSNILSVGKYNTFYSSFGSYVANYFNLPVPDNLNSTNEQGISTGLATLYSGEYNFYPNDGVFDNSALLDMLTKPAVDAALEAENYAPVGASYSGLSGSISLSQITEALRFAVVSNCFGNRSNGFATDNYGDSSYNTASESVNQHTNYGVSDGFIAGDIITIGSNAGNIENTIENTTVTTGGINLNVELKIDPTYGSGQDEILIRRSLGGLLTIHLVNASQTTLSVQQSGSNLELTGDFIYYDVQTSLYDDYGFSTAVQFTRTAPNEIYTPSNTEPVNFFKFVPIDVNGYKGNPVIIYL